MPGVMPCSRWSELLGKMISTRPIATASDKTSLEGATSLAAVGTGQRTGARDRPIGKRGQKYKTKPITAAGPQ